MSDFEAARLTVRLGAIASNFRNVQRMSGPAAVAGVVKADAYGMGMMPVARRLAETGCDTFFVARLEEGVALRPIVPGARIFVLDGAPPDAVPALITHRLTPVSELARRDRELERRRTGDARDRWTPSCISTRA